MARQCELRECIILKSERLYIEGAAVFTLKIVPSISGGGGGGSYGEWSESFREANVLVCFNRSESVEKHF